MTVNIKTYGCKLNVYDSGLLEKSLEKFQWNDSSEIHILNSCAVTSQATGEALKQARRIKSKNPKAVVVLTGCSAQVDALSTDQDPHIDLVVANSHKGELGTFLNKHLQGQLDQKVFRSNIFKKQDFGEGGGEESFHTRSYLKIQDGCNSFCRFCIIPFARGKSRSLSVQKILIKVNELKKKGFNEVVLTGVHIGDYLDNTSHGGPFRLDDLVEQILLNTRIPRVRLTSLEPIELTDKLMGLFKNNRLCPHFHMSLQSLSTEVLKLMGRKYTAENVKKSLYWIDKDHPRSFVGLDVITGFPGETEERFNETYENLKRWPWTCLHVFPYSERQGTSAVRDKTLQTLSVPWSLRKKRAKILRQLSQNRYNRKAEEQKGHTKQALILKKKGDLTQALSQDYWKIFLKTKKDLKKGSLEKVKISSYKKPDKNHVNGFLFGECL